MAEDLMRPSSFDEYVGQQDLKDDLNIRIAAAKASNRPLNHMLFVGPKGSGKTSLAECIGSALGEPTEMYQMPITMKTLMNVIKSFEGLVVLDEIDQLGRPLQFALMPLVERGFLQHPSGKRITTDWLTVIGTTTEPHKILPSLYDKFPVKPTWSSYADEELAVIATNMGHKVGIAVPPDIALAIGQAGMGSPRHVKDMVEAYKDLVFATSQGTPTIDDVLRLCQTSSDGLSRQHVEYLVTLDALGGTKGLKVIASLLGLHPDFVQDLERLLVHRGLVELTDSGRGLTRSGFARVKAAAA